MDLSIRSQDRKRLVKYEKLVIVEFTDKTECEIWNDTVKLGTYKNIERAIEILDQINKVLEININVETNYQQADIIIKGQMLSYMSKVYIMPLE